MPPWPDWVAPLFCPACKPTCPSRIRRTSSSLKFLLFSVAIFGPRAFRQHPQTCLPSFQRFFYQNSQNMTFYQFLCKILTNKSTRKKIQLVEGTKEIVSNNFRHNWRSLRCLNKLKCVTQVYSTILGHCFYCFWQPIRRQLLKAWQAADQ